MQCFVNSIVSFNNVAVEEKKFSPIMALLTDSIDTISRFLGVKSHTESEVAAE